jgi:dTDP-4-amino-4,6-dideoxygalactose transaminase
MINPFQVVRDFERAVCDYTGAPYCVTTNSCTMALLLAVKYYVDCCGLVRPMPKRVVTIPSKTYVGVPMSVINAGAEVQFKDKEWLGMYQLEPLPVWDSARYFTSDMYIDGTMQCVSFHATKILGDTQGGAILHDNAEADRWLRRMRFDGRTEGVPPNKDAFTEIGYHCYISPDVAARLLHKLSVLPSVNRPLDNDDYPDLSTFKVFR